MSRRLSIGRKIKTEPVDDVEIFEVETILDKRIILGKVCTLKIHAKFIEPLDSMLKLHISCLIISFNTSFFFLNTFTFSATILDQIQRVSRLGKYLGANRKS